MHQRVAAVSSYPVPHAPCALPAATVPRVCRASSVQRAAMRAQTVLWRVFHVGLVNSRTFRRRQSVPNAPPLQAVSQGPQRALHAPVSLDVRCQIPSLLALLVACPALRVLPGRTVTAPLRTAWDAAQGRTPR